MKYEERKKWHGICAIYAQKFYDKQRKIPEFERRTLSTNQMYLCGWCKFQDWDAEYGDYGSVLSSWPTCEHTLKNVREGNQPVNDDGYSLYKDCWGFRPRQKFQDVVQTLDISEENARQMFANALHENDTLDMLFALFLENKESCYKHCNYIHKQQSWFFHDSPPHDCRLAECRNGCPLWATAEMEINNANT